MKTFLKGSCSIFNQSIKRFYKFKDEYFDSKFNLNLFNNNLFDKFKFLEKLKQKINVLETKNFFQ